VGSSDAAPVEGHLSPSEVARIAAEARPRELWLTHFYPGTDPDEAVARIAATGVPVRRAADQDVWG
jgi:ribonuclease BN (tRNA processing enzyme)